MATTAVSTTASESSSSTKSSSGLPRVLAVDDSRANRLVMRNFMTDLGFDVQEAADGIEALAHVRRQTPNLLLVDWEMPGMNGLELVQAVRTRISSQELPIVMVTSVTALERVEQALAAGADEYIMKPFTREVLAEKLGMLGIQTL